MSLFDSEIYKGLFNDEEVAVLFNDDAEIRALIRIESSLAKVQGDLGLIPKQSAKVIQTSLKNIHIQPAALMSATKRDGVPVPSLIQALRAQMDSSAHAQYLHWGATSQDIMDTALMLRLRTVCEIFENRLVALLLALATLAEKHAELPMAARTRAQIATPTSFGAMVACWGSPLLNHLTALAKLKPGLLKVSLAGASGNSAVMGAKAAAVRTALATELGLSDSSLCWHSDRTALAEFVSLLARISASLAKMAGDCLLANQSEVAELVLKNGGGSSTMPQKNNPVIAETIVSLSYFNTALSGLMTQALLHRQQRDGAAWAQEWLALPPICVATAKSLKLAQELVSGIVPNADAMKSRLAGANGQVYAEAISFRLAENMPRPEAQARVKALCREAIEQGCSLEVLVSQYYPDIDWTRITNTDAQLGDAPQQAGIFVNRVRQL